MIAEAKAEDPVVLENTIAATRSHIEEGQKQVLSLYNEARLRQEEARRLAQERIKEVEKKQQDALHEYAGLGLFAFKRKKELVDLIARFDVELDELRKI